MSYALEHLAQRYKPVIGAEPSDAEYERAREIAGKFLHWHEGETHRLTVPKAIYQAFRPLFEADLMLPVGINPDSKTDRLAAFSIELAATVEAAAKRLAMREPREGRILDANLESALVEEVKYVYPAMREHARAMIGAVGESIIGAQASAYLQ